MIKYTFLSILVASIIMALLLFGKYLAKKEVMVDRKDAGLIAQSFMLNQPEAVQYQREPFKINDKDSYWEVIFQLKEPMRPAYGAIGVDKKTRQARWIPLR
jgi:hypothetical protein